MDCLIVGSSVTDFFTEIAPGDHASVSNKTVTFHLGDKVPIQISKQVMGGNGMNVSVGLSRLEVPVSFYTYIGNDEYARQIEAFLEKEKVTVYSEKDSETSDLSFILDIKDDRIIFSHHPLRDHGFISPEEKKFDVIFLSSIGDKWEDAYEKVINYASYSQTPIVFSPGSRQISDLNDIFFSALHASKYILINKDEAIEILEKFGSSHTDIQSILKGLYQLGPKIISITDGANGAYAYDGVESYHIESLPKEEKTEKTGAGDAYASGFLAALFQEQTIPEAMKWGSLNARSVMKEIGAQEELLTKQEMLQLLEKHGTFKAEKI
jgi:ribokinase